MTDINQNSNIPPHPPIVKVGLVILSIVILGLVLFISLISVIRGGNLSDEGGVSYRAGG